MAPIDMILYCPNCGEQHVDEEDLMALFLREEGTTCDTAPDSPYGLRWSDGVDRPYPWTNPPHRSHLCHFCKCVWRPADVPTNGVASIKTEGKADTWPAYAGEVAAAKAKR